MRKSVFIVIFLALSIAISAQVNEYGVPFVEHYSTQITGGSEQYWCITKDVFGNLWLGNHDMGVAKYDGTKWTNISVKDNPRMFDLRSDDRGVIFVGAAFEFGYIQPGEKGGYEYVSLAERLDTIANILYVYSIVIENGTVNFLSPRNIYKYDIEKDTLSTVDLRAMGITDANRLVTFGDKMLLADQSSGLYEFDGENVRQLPNADNIKDKFLTALLPYDEDNILVTPYGEGIFLYNLRTGAVNRSFVDNTLNTKFAEEGVYSAVQISSSQYAISTTVGGVYIVNHEGELVQYLNVANNSLMDNTGCAMYCDCINESELWVATYGYITKIAFNIPITKFDLGYNINDIGEFNGDIILSTDAGIVRMYVDESGEAKFSDIISGTNEQIFPIQEFDTDEGTYLLAGGLAGVMQIDKNYRVKLLQDNIVGTTNNESIKFSSRKILPSNINQGVVYFGNDPGGVIVLRYQGGKWHYISNYTGLMSGVVTGLVEGDDGSLWVITTDPFSVLRIKDPLISKDDVEITSYGPDKGLPEVRLLSADKIGDDIYITTSKGLFRYDSSEDRFVGDNSLTGGFSEGVYTQSIFTDNEGDVWLSGLDETYFDMIFHKEQDTVIAYSGVLRLLPNAPSLGSFVKDDRIYLTKTKTVAVIDKKNIKEEKRVPNTYFTSIVVGSDTIMYDNFHSDIDGNRRVPMLNNMDISVPEYKYDMNKISFEWTTPYFVEELHTEYSYLLEGYETEWSDWEAISFGYNFEDIFAYYAGKQYENLPYGHYTFKVRTRTITGIETEGLSYEFIILKPWYLTTAAILLWIVIIGGIIMAIMAIYTKRLKDENIRLEGIVAERTEVVVKQKEELESSIHYASRIQFALLPSKAILDENLENNFILFRPRDIVSGDYYWMSKRGDRLYVVAADCTGHGVPGAFMSLLGMSFLEEIVRRNEAPPANVVLDQLRLHVIESLKQAGKDNDSKDGMDMGLLVFDFKNKKVEFSGAYNPCYRVRKMTRKEMDNPDLIPQESINNGKYVMDMIDANKMPIGISLRMEENFNLFTEDMEPGITYYMSSDGYIDQFGGTDGKKFMKKNFKKLLLDIQGYPMEEQRAVLEQRLIDWMGPIAQIDDIIVLGVKTV